MRGMQYEKEDKNVIVDAIVNKFYRNMTVLSIADEKSFSVISFFFCRSIKQLQPFYSIIHYLFILLYDTKSTNPLELAEASN